MFKINVNVHLCLNNLLFAFVIVILKNNTDKKVEFMYVYRKKNANLVLETQKNSTNSKWNIYCTALPLLISILFIAIIINVFKKTFTLIN